MVDKRMSRVPRVCLIAMWVVIGIGGAGGSAILAAMSWLDSKTVTIRVVDSEGRAISDAAVFWPPEVEVPGLTNGLREMRYTDG